MNPATWHYIELENHQTRQAFYRVCWGGTSDGLDWATVVWYGKLATEGVASVKPFRTMEGAQNYARDKVREKLSGGYEALEGGWIDVVLPADLIRRITPPPKASRVGLEMAARHDLLAKVNKARFDSGLPTVWPHRFAPGYRSSTPADLTAMAAEVTALLADL